MTLLEEYKKIIKESGHLAHAVNLMYWDMQTTAPEGGKEKLSEAITYFSTELFKRNTSDEFYNLVCKLAEPEEFDKLDDVMKFDITKTKRDLDKSRRVPQDYYEEYVKTTTNSSMLWPKAKQENNWELYREPLARTIEAVKKYQGYMNPDKKAYDALIDQFEEGMTQETIDRVFGELKEALVPMVNKILAAPQPDHSKFTMTIPAHKQAQLCKFLVEYMGMDMNRFAQSETEHPFTTSMSINDVRITNHYYENDVISPIFSAIHEGGHAIFEQNVDQKYDGTSGASIDLMGLHESQSRFYENILGRNENFWKPIWPKVLEIVPEFKDITLEEFVREINHVENSFIRTEADELTYCLHIILRYEIERAIFIDGAKVEDLPRMWNDKTQELLHITPATDAEGILQDMHWSDASFGYFPSYLLGSIYDGMFLEAIEKDLGSVDDILAAGDIKKITKWLNTNIHQFGSTRISSEVLDKVCGKELSAAPLIRHFKEKYSKIYGIEL
jgi:carboxypeptidase Taq